MIQNPIVWVEIPVKDMQRAMKFYEAFFKVKLEEHNLGELEMAWFPMDSKAKGCSAGLVKHERCVPSAHGTLAYFWSPSGDIAADLKRAEELGGKIYMPAKDIGFWGWIGAFGDTEGNSIGLYSGKKG